MVAVNRRNLIYKLSLLLLIALVTVWRHPELFYQPRFYAEEGSCFFSYAYNHTWLENLLHPQFGYYTLYNFAITSFATIFPLEVAPLVTTCAAFILQMIVSWALLRADIPELDSNFKRFVAALAIPLLPYIVIWLNTLGAQYMLCVITFIVLLEAPVCRPWFGVTIRGIGICLAGLTGVVSCFMLPSFFYKTLRTKSGPFAIYSSILTISSVVQIGVFLQARLNNDGALSMRFVHHSIDNLLRVMTKFTEFQFFIPFFGRVVRNTGIFESLERGIRSTIPLLAEFGLQLGPALIGAVIAIFMFIIMYYKRHDLNTQVILISFVFTTVLSTLFSVNMTGGPRYTFAPAVMLIILFISSWGDQRIAKPLRTVAGVLVFCMIITNGFESRFASLGVNFEDWPKWSDEVRFWRTNHLYPLRIWPPSWKVTLKAD